MQHVFKLPKEYTFQAVGIRGTNFETKELCDRTKFFVIETETGHETRIREKECDFNYYVLEGKGNFEIDCKVEKCQKGDMIIIPRGSVFKYTGKMKLFLITDPYWRPEQEETL